MKVLAGSYFFDLKKSAYYVNNNKKRIQCLEFKCGYEYIKFENFYHIFLLLN